MLIPRFRQKKSIKGSILSCNELFKEQNSLSILHCSSIHFNLGIMLRQPCHDTGKHLIFFWYQANMDTLNAFLSNDGFQNKGQIKGQCLEIASGSVSAVTKTNTMNPLKLLCLIRKSQV